LKSLLIVLAVALIAGNVSAETVTFDSLSGSNGDLYGGSTEGNFSVTPTSGDWFEAHFFGDPVPSLFGTSDIGVLTISENTSGLFNFVGVDIAHASANDPGLYAIDGYLNDVLMFSTSGLMPSLIFEMISSPDALQTIDRLTLTLDRGIASYNVDNFVLQSVVPEPSTAVMLSLGLMLFGLYGSRRN